jgi:predicted dithiol-disulfide oxidoreductase (DUF899 family)
MASHLIGTREEWREARLKLLAAEKEHTRRSDELAAMRRELPWVRVDKDYLFDTDEGTNSLADLFKGRSQLLFYHLMFGPDYVAPCPSCSMIADGFNGFAIHLAHHDVMLVAVSRASLAKLQATKMRLGWTFPWASAHSSDFNFDFNVSLTEEQQGKGGAEYNFHPLPARSNDGSQSKFARMCGTDTATYLRDLPGMSAFIIDDGVLYHTYSAYARGVDGLWGAYQWLDRAPLGRNEPPGAWWRRRDEYPKEPACDGDPLQPRR